VIDWRFGLSGGTEHTLAEIGRKLGLSRERVRQIESAALAKLRRGVEPRGLCEALGEPTRQDAARSLRLQS
jgi:RNA polymerase primary sigma factor